MGLTKHDLPLPPPASPSDSKTLSESDYAAAAVRIGCDVPTVKAVAEVESAGRGYLSDGRPAILFEAHVFDRLTGGKHRARTDRRGVPLSSPRWNRTLYGKGGAAQYDRLEDAMALDERAAVLSCSWGPFQIMGTNFASLGFPDVDSLREFMEATDQVQEHLDLFVRFILVNGLDDELRARDWRGFARGYNGPGYEQNRYHEKLAAAYQKHLERA